LRKVRVEIGLVALSTLASIAILGLFAPLIGIYLKLKPEYVKEYILPEPYRSEILGALKVSLIASIIAVLILIIVGVPLAYILARFEFPLKSIVQGLVDLPLVIPHAVSGILILSAYGSSGLLGPLLGRAGLRIEDSYAGIIAVMTFVSAPLLVDTVKVGFETIPESLVAVARSLGARRSQALLHVELPLVFRHILAGALMAWARGLSEVGALLIVAYYPKTINILIIEFFDVLGLGPAIALSALYLLLILLIFIILREVISS